MAAQAVAPHQFKDARKELGLGCPPEDYGTNADQALADFCSPQSRLEVGETARWIIDTPVLDNTIVTTFGNRWNVWGTRDEQPPPGVAEATNTMATPNLFPGNFLIRGFQVRILVPPEGRLIRGALYNVPSGSFALPGIADDWTQNDWTNGAFGTLPAGATEPVKALLYSGTACWKVAYPLVNAMELNIGQNHQDSLIKQPLTACATVQPFTEAEAAGTVYGGSIDDVNAFNQRMVDLGSAQQFILPAFKRLGALTVGGVDVGDFTVSREEDGEPTMWGGPGVPVSPFQRTPFLLDVPMFWPAGQSLSILLDVSSSRYLQQAQRWLSVTGGSGGNTGADLNLPPSNLLAGVVGYTGLAPTTSGATGMLEQTLDAAPVNVAQQSEVGRAVLKFGRMVIEIVAYGWRMTNPSWEPVVARAIRKGAIIAPAGHGSLNMYMRELQSQGR